MEPFCPQETQFDKDEYGSLNIKPLVVVRRRKRSHYVCSACCPSPKSVENSETRLKAHFFSDIPETTFRYRKRKYAKELPQLMSDVPLFARPIRKQDGSVIKRPKKAPKTISAILANSESMEFFRRYMVVMGKDTQLQFWKAVDQLKDVKDPQMKKKFVTMIFRKFLLDKSSEHSVFFSVKSPEESFMRVAAKIK